MSGKLPLEGHRGASECGKWSGYSAVSADEPMIEVDQTQEVLQLLAGVGNRPSGGCRDLLQVHLDAPIGHNVPQKGNRTGMKLTLLRLDE